MSTQEAQAASGDDTRFVVLRHDERTGTHYDLMILVGDRLATWRCPRPPEDSRVQPMCCERIGDHRVHYLEYEGPVSGDRGVVRRHDAGPCRRRVEAGGEWQLWLEGGLLRGGYTLAPGPQGWWLRPVGGSLPSDSTVRSSLPGPAEKSRTR